MIRSKAAIHPIQVENEHSATNNENEVDYLIDMTIFSLLYRFSESEKVILTVDEFLFNLDKLLEQLVMDRLLRAEYRLYKLEKKEFLKIDPLSNVITLTTSGKKVSNLYFPILQEIARKLSYFGRG
ncbi:MAG: hypothetical protein ACXAEU_23420 [Candidatus Hodarchaeales archaeon]|jgi:hypothetical protein